MAFSLDDFSAYSHAYNFSLIVYAFFIEQRCQGYPGVSNFTDRTSYGITNSVICWHQVDIQLLPVPGFYWKFYGISLLMIDQRPTNDRSLIWKISSGDVSAGGHPIHFMFGYRVQFSRSAGNGANSIWTKYMRKQ